MKVLDILKKLHKKVTGQDTEAKNLTEILASMEENYTAQPGGTSETYETVAEIQVGEMEKNDNLYLFSFTNSEIPAFVNGESCYLNNAENQGTVYIDSDGIYLMFNTEDPDRLTPTDPDKPVMAITFVSDEGVIISDSEDLSNTTVRILKAASEPSVLPEVTAADNGDVLTVVNGEWAKAEPSTELPSVTASDNGDFLSVVNGSWAKTPLPANLKPTYEFGFTITAGQTAGTYVATPDTGVTFVAIQAALAETDNVYAVATLPDGQVLKALFNALDDDYVSAGSLFYAGDNNYTAYRVRVQSDDSCDVVIVALADAH